MVQGLGSRAEGRAVGLGADLCLYPNFISPRGSAATTPPPASVMHNFTDLCTRMMHELTDLCEIGLLPNDL